MRVECEVDDTAVYRIDWKVVVRLPESTVVKTLKNQVKQLLKNVYVIVCQLFYVENINGIGQDERDFILNSAPRFEEEGITLRSFI